MGTVPGVRNRHTTAAVDPANGQLTFLYTLANGPADQSYGAHVAELAGFPARVVAAARKGAEEFEANGDFCQGSTKRLRVGDKLAEDDAQPMAQKAVSQLLASRDEDAFVRQCLDQLPLLRQSSA